MKIRRDFVTNSSSSSFIVARKGELNDKQKEKLAEYIEKRFLGKRAISNLDELPQYADDYYMSNKSEKYQKAQEALSNGMTLQDGSIDHEIGEFTDDIYVEIWSILERYSDGNFMIVDGDMTY